MNRYKNKALNLDEMRRRREEEGIQLRKQKREQQVTFLIFIVHYYRFFRLVTSPGPILHVFPSLTILLHPEMHHVTEFKWIMNAVSR